MKAPVYKIEFRQNAHAVLAEMLFENEHDFHMDFRDGKTLVFSKEWWDMEMVTKDDIQSKLEDVCCVGEFDYTPKIIIDEEYDWSLDEYEVIQDRKDNEPKEDKFNRMLNELDQWGNDYLGAGASTTFAVTMAHNKCQKKYPEIYKEFVAWIDKGSAGPMG